MRISDWSSDVCSSDLGGRDFARFLITDAHGAVRFEREGMDGTPVRVLQIPFLQGDGVPMLVALIDEEESSAPALGATAAATLGNLVAMLPFGTALSSDEHTSALQSLMRISYAVFCLTTQIQILKHTTHD